MHRKSATKNRLCLALIGLSFVLFGLPVTVVAEYPDRPIKLIIPYSPGGVSDLTWRGLTSRMGEVLGQPIVIMNKPGGGATLGYTMLANSKPDGYTIGHITLGSLINNYLMYDVTYDPDKHFTYIAGIAELTGSIIVKPDAPWKTWEEFVNYSKQHPNEVRMGYSGTGAVTTVATKWISRKYGLKWREVTFPGEAEGMLALLSGSVDAFPGPSAHNRLIDEGRARPLLSLTVDPIPAYPKIPTFKQVYNQHASNANGLMVPAGVPEPIRKKLENAVLQATKEQKFKDMLKQMFMTPEWKTSEEFTQSVKQSLISYKELLGEVGMLKKKN
jgi:tripartite-type tricarboxylate transporter receptor subunit TctC